MPEPPRCEQWKIDVNDRYQKVVDLLIGLPTAALVLPTLFLREFLGVPAENPLLIYLDGSAYFSFAAFLSTIVTGVLYNYASTKWVKCAWGQPTFLSSHTIERLLDWAFWGMAISFILGLVSFLIFVSRA